MTQCKGRNRQHPALSAHHEADLGRKSCNGRTTFNASWSRIYSVEYQYGVAFAGSGSLTPHFKRKLTNLLKSFVSKGQLYATQGRLKLHYGSRQHHKNSEVKMRRKQRLAAISMEKLVAQAIPFHAHLCDVGTLVSLKCDLLLCWIEICLLHHGSESTSTSKYNYVL